MTTLVERAASPTQATTLRALARVEALRYARHPLFLVGVALLTATMLTDWDGVEVTYFSDLALGPAFLLGLLGVFVGAQLARSTAGSRDAVEAAPTDAVHRTAALCLACLVPGVAGLAWVAAMQTVIVMVPLPGSPTVSSGDRAAILLTAAVYAVGGPLVGVMVGRWTRFPGAALATAVTLAVWALVAGTSEGMRASHLSSLVQLQAPFTTWSGGLVDEEPWYVGGSPQWYLAYITLLCGLAATAAMLREASRPQRSRLVRVLVVLAVLALATVGLAAAADPTRVPL